MQIAKSGQQEDKESKEELEALPNKLADYDSNADGILYYEEFAHAIMSAHKIRDPRELRGLFDQCDTNGEYIYLIQHIIIRCHIETKAFLYI